ncbi:oxidoreductase [Variovorax sp. WS11]|uniref:PDR/VanB family oxidoreductase n=1 Tax=Variovorax sp. WS11 TaxID=1105204 RepID=UPI000D0D3B88|nr:PDR/VanB family oxidoreductase [Variovorax sp. WS11]NDZ17011.1 oxidoreductase [Variovorax sp. WS11]PSL81379.1 oxidoreductase [Variovorax sp. WS11]
MNTATLSVRVARRIREAVDIASFELVPTGSEPLPSFSAGAHVDVHLPGGLVRQYSLCNDPSEPHRYLIAVLRDGNGRGGSRAMHELVNEGDTLTISAPKNHFPLKGNARRSLLLAGGIGVTPILCMVERLAVAEDEFEMHYCARSAERMAFRERIATAAFAANVTFHLDDGAPSQKLDLDRLLAQPQDGVQLYVCGPRGFMDGVLQAARDRGWPETQLHYEFFTGEAVKTAADSSFDVQLARSGRVVHVAAHATVAQALVAAGVELPTSCEQGVCGTCLTRVLRGLPDHRDSYLTSDEREANDQFLPCCSRSKTPLLVLDI